ncbi:mitochondrial RBP_receptor domain-containing protein [Andalucia godoyi]|uniref:Mitochondrial RBP_receptor domain-containing protein n=1 Tax=Andalucia godoyi TaxID=505711 RepID=A0A8K0AIR9_ANDGO|nr:mitochondrial RBP_receptor domain-containing protein [Andalucia godoyi]|eukprot:ANDGO_04057.mRNA.1 mitochondrial RBP_receptor domain-containing protein
MSVWLFWKLSKSWTFFQKKRQGEITGSRVSHMEESSSQVEIAPRTNSPSSPTVVSEEIVGAEERDPEPGRYPDHGRDHGQEALRIVCAESKTYRAAHNRRIALWSLFSFDLTVERLRTLTIPACIMSGFIVVIVFQVLFRSLFFRTQESVNVFVTSISAGILFVFAYANDVRSGKVASVVFLCFALVTLAIAIFNLVIAGSNSSGSLAGTGDTVLALVFLIIFAVVVAYAIRLSITAFKSVLPTWLAMLGLGTSMFVSKRSAYSTHVRTLLAGKRPIGKGAIASVRLSVRFSMTMLACSLVLVVLGALCIGSCILVATYEVPQFLLDALKAVESLLDVSLDHDFSLSISSLRRALITAVFSASALTIAVAGIIIYRMITLYRERMLLLRKGRYFYGKSSPHVLSASWYPGPQVGHFFLGVTIMFVMLLLLFIPVGLALFVQGVFSYLVLFALNKAGGSLGTWLLSIFLFWICTRWITDESGQTILHLRRHMLFDMVMVCFGAVSCLVNVLIRSIWLLVRFISAIIRLDQTVVPVEHERRDKGFVNYLSMVSLDHYYNSPVALIAEDIFLALHWSARELSTSSALSGNKDYGTVQQRQTISRARLRWKIAYTLLRNPSVVHLRKERKSADTSKTPLQDSATLQPPTDLVEVQIQPV